MEIASFIFSAFALLGTAFVYFRHEKKLKDQEAIINAYQIEKIKEAEELAKKAIIRISEMPREVKGEKRFRVYNKGIATAYNLDLKIEQKIDGVTIMNNPFPCAFLDFEESRVFDIPTDKSSPDSITMTLTWKDEHLDHNSLSTVLNLR